MADKSRIEWTDATWNHITGCTLVDEGCRHCYAAHLITSWPAIGNHPSRKGLARKNAAGESKFTGEVRFNEQWLDQPLRWKKPRRIFVCAHGDMFHENVPDEWIDKSFAVMALTPHHTYQVLTKRPDLARAYFEGRRSNFGRASEIAHDMPHPLDENTAQTAADTLDLFDSLGRPQKNVWIGTSISDQASANQRVPQLLAIPAAVRFLSVEPMLGAIDLAAIQQAGHTPRSALDRTAFSTANERGLPDAGLDWVICGGESGPNARPMHPDWARSLRDQCQAAAVPFFFKQWGEWGDMGSEINVQRGDKMRLDMGVIRTGKARAGRLLDGREWNQMPEVQHG